MLLKRKPLLLYILISFIILLLIIPTFSFAFDKNSIYVWSDFSSVSTSINPSEEEISVNTENDNFLGITSGSAILMDQKTGQVLYEYNSHKKLNPASVTKIMTILLIMEALDNGTITLDTRNSM